MTEHDDLIKALSALSQRDKDDVIREFNKRLQGDPRTLHQRGFDIIAESEHETLTLYNYLTRSIAESQELLIADGELSEYDRGYTEALKDVAKDVFPADKELWS